ncbi:MAG TPA: hypothetical protein VMZ91_14150 [Candidatus Paceibacterota bacterium]|nr:hypothetical protein [Candidatus Paceibacterota bacterium]
MIESNKKEEKNACKLIENAKYDPNWDTSLNSKLCKGDCKSCPYLISNDHTMVFEIKHKLNPEHPHPYLELGKELFEICQKHLGSFLLETTLKERR